MRKRGQAYTDSWNGLFDTQASPTASVSKCFQGYSAATPYTRRLKPQASARLRIMNTAISRWKHLAVAKTGVLQMVVFVPLCSFIHDNPSTAPALSRKLTNFAKLRRCFVRRFFETV